MNRVLDCHAPLLELIGELLHLVLRARHGHAVPRHEDHQLREGKQRREVLDGGGVDGAALCACGAAGSLHF